jgi:hypothetical protein
MDFGLAFSFPFKDPDWLKKIVIIGLVGLIPVIGQFVLLGWAFEIVRRVIRNHPEPLPNLEFGENLGKGFQVWLIYLVYAIPIFIMMIPIALLDNAGANMLANGGDTGGTAVAVLAACCGAVAFLYGILMTLVIPAAVGNFADKGSVGAAFRFGEVFGLVRAAPVAYLIIMLTMVFISPIVASIGTILCVVGVVLTLAYSQAIVYHLTGQAYKQAARIY